MNLLKSIINSPWTTLVVGVALLITSVYETIESIAHPQLGVHHGLLLYSVVQILRSLPHIVEGVEKVTGAVEQEEMSD